MSLETTKSEHVGWWAGSATQIDNYASCERKWWLQSVKKEGKDESAALSFGTDVHACLEQALLGSAPAGPPSPYIKDALRLAARALVADSWLMSTVAGRDLSRDTVEIEFEDYETFVVPVRGKIDLLLVDFFHEDKRIAVRIIDHKTTKSRKYILGAKRLRKNIQGLLYANHAYHTFLRQYPDYEITVEFFLHYLIKEEEDAAPVVSSVVYTDGDLISGRAMLNDLLERMSVDARKEIYTDVLTRPSACSKYGGCPFRNRCFGLTPLDVYKETDMEFWTVLDKKTGNGANVKELAPSEKETPARPTVFVDCIPYNERVVSAEEWLHDEIRAYEAKMKMPYLASPYNEGVKAVVAQATGSGKALPAMLHISSQSPIGSLLIAALKDRDALLVFGMR